MWLDGGGVEVLEEKAERLALLLKLAKGRDKERLAWRIIRMVAFTPCREPFWECVKRETGLSEKKVKEIMDYLEKAGELTIIRSKDGRHLYVSTLRRIRRSPVNLDRWIKVGDAS